MGMYFRKMKNQEGGFVQVRIWEVRYDYAQEPCVEYFILPFCDQKPCSSVKALFEKYDPMDWPLLRVVNVAPADDFESWPIIILKQVVQLIGY